MLFQDVVTQDIGTSVWAAARLGRAEVSAMKNMPDDQMTADYRFVIKTLQESKGEPTIDDSSDSGNHRTPEMVSIDQVRGSVVAQHQRYANADRLRDALQFLALQKEINEPEAPATVYRLASTKERLAGEVLKEIDSAPDETTRAAKRREATGLLIEAGNDYQRHAQLTTMDDATSGDSLWHAAKLFDQAGQTEKSIAVYEKFTEERPRDPRTPDGLLNMGLLHQSVGRLDTAIDLYKRNIKENPHTPAAYRSAVELAKCYMALGTTGPGNEANYAGAEKSLLSLVQDNSDLLPTANEFRTSLFTLGELYYRNGKWADAILRLEETIARYPNDSELLPSLFMLAESYRNSAAEIGEAVRKNPGIDHRDALMQARAERLSRAASLFSRVISTLDNAGQSGACRWTESALTAASGAVPALELYGSRGVLFQPRRLFGGDSALRPDGHAVRPEADRHRSVCADRQLLQRAERKAAGGGGGGAGAVDSQTHPGRSARHRACAGEPAVLRRFFQPESPASGRLTGIFWRSNACSR